MLDTLPTCLMLCTDGDRPAAQRAAVACIRSIGLDLQHWDMRAERLPQPGPPVGVLLVAFGPSPGPVAHLRQYIAAGRAAGPLAVLHLADTAADSAAPFTAAPSDPLWDGVLPTDDPVNLAAQLRLWVRLQRAEMQAAARAVMAHSQARHDGAVQRDQIDLLTQEGVAREQFVAALSHDLRTPLTAARMSTERLVRHLAAEPKSLRVAERVLRSLLRTDAMIGDFLDVSRVCAGRNLVLERVPKTLREIVQCSLEEMDPLHANRCQLAPSDSGEGCWDETTVRRLVDNLVGNALKYSDRDTPITVRIQQSATQTCLEVHNVGSPITAVDQNRLFAHFDRLDNAMLGGERGWGIGLTLVACIARAYDGRVVVHSDAAAGTTFRVLFPPS